MWDGFIGKQIRRGDRNLLLTNLGLLLVPIAVGIMSPRYWHNFSFGPFPIEKQALLSIQNPDTEEKYFLTVEGDKSFKTGLQQITQRVSKSTGNVTSEEVSADYVALKVGQKILVVKAKLDHANNTKFTGELVNIPENVQSELIDKTEAKYPHLKGVFLPYMLQEDDFRFPGYMGLAAGIPCLVIGVWNLQKVLKRRSAPELHPIAKSLTKLSDYPESTAAQIDSEVQSDINKFSLESLQITASWLLRQTRFGLDIMKLEQIVWIYEKVTQHRTNGIPTGKTYAAIIINRQGESIEIPGNKQNVEQILLEIINRVPWVLAGFSQELQNLWMSDRTKLFEVVEQRRWSEYRA